MLAIEKTVAALTTGERTARITNTGTAVISLETLAALLADNLADAARQSGLIYQVRVVFPELRLCFAVTRPAQRNQVFKLVGFKVVVKEAERSFVMHAQLLFRSAVPTLEPVPTLGFFLLLGPVGASIVFVSTPPGWTGSAAHESLHEFNTTRSIAEIARPNSAREFGDYCPALVARYLNLLRLPWARVGTLPQSVAYLSAEMPTGPLGDVIFGFVGRAALIAG